VKLADGFGDLVGQLGELLLNERHRQTTR
jgi:hypothetical protein